MLPSKLNFEIAPELYILPFSKVRIKKSLTQIFYVRDDQLTVVPPCFKRLMTVLKKKKPIFQSEYQPPIHLSFLYRYEEKNLLISTLCNVRTRHPLLTFTNS